MPIDPCCPMSAWNTLRKITGDTIRPGGLQVTDRALSLCGLPNGARALDVGCGLGGTVRHLAATHRLAPVGCDLSAPLLREGRRRAPGLPLVQAPGECLPFVGKSLDLVLAECTLSVTGRPEKVLAECSRVLRPGGVLIVSDLYARNSGSDPALPQVGQSSCFGGLCSPPRIRQILKAEGFNLLRWEDHSATLKHLAVQFVLSQGSLESFWEAVSCGIGDGKIKQRVAQARPGYFLLVARKGPQ